MSDIHEKVDQALDKKDKSIFTKDFEQVKDNYKFAHKIETDPIKDTKKYDTKIFNYVVLSFNNYLNQMAWPSSLYFIDKINRLNMRASLEMIKKNLKKKNTVPMNLIWLLILMAIAGFVVLIVVFLVLPRVTGG